MIRNFCSFIDAGLKNIKLNRIKYIATALFLCFVYLVYKSETSLSYDEMMVKLNSLKFTVNDEPPAKLEKTPKLLDNEPTSTQSIFLLNTSDVSHGIELLPRQACAVESAAVINPNRQVYMLITEEVDYNKFPLNNVTAALLTYPNIHLMYFNLYETVKGSVLESWFNTSSLMTSNYRVVHFSDIFRLMMMRKYGGVYMDLDMIALQDFDTIPENFACLEVHNPKNDMRPGNAFLGFNGELGNKILDMYLKEIKEHYQPNQYVGNGPVMLTTILNRFCNETDIDLMTVEACQGFYILPKTKCFDFIYWEWYDLFDVKKTNQSIERLKKNDAVVTHYFTSVSRNHKFPSKDVNAFTTLGKKLCPRVMDNVGEFIQ